MRLGPSPQDLTRFGSSRVMRGNGLVAKAGSPEGIAREAFLLGEAVALMPLGLPTLVEAGPGWILTEDVGGEPIAPVDVSPLQGLARMHELFEGATGIEHERFRDVFGREQDGLLAEARVSANAAALPEPLASLLADPSPSPMSSPRSRGRSYTGTRGPATCWSAEPKIRVARFDGVGRGTGCVRPRGLALRLAVGGRFDEPRGRARRVLRRSNDAGRSTHVQACGGCSRGSRVPTDASRALDRP